MQAEIKLLYSSEF